MRSGDREESRVYEQERVPSGAERSGKGPMSLSVFYFFWWFGTVVCDAK